MASWRSVEKPRHIKVHFRWLPLTGLFCLAFELPLEARLKPMPLKQGLV
jgi:hypothetical protein